MRSMAVILVALMVLLAGFMPVEARIREAGPSDLRFSFDVPDNWIVNDKDAGKNSLTITAPKQAGFFSVSLLPYTGKTTKQMANGLAESVSKTDKPPVHDEGEDVYSVNIPHQTFKTVTVKFMPVTSAYFMMLITGGDESVLIPVKRTLKFRMH